MRSYSLTLAALTALSAGCLDLGLDTGDDRRAVIGGSPTEAGAFAATGALILEGDPPQTPAQYVSCTGTLVAPDVVVTAAHCVHPALTQNATPGFTLALDGMSAEASEIHAGASAIPHPSFDPFGGSPPAQLSTEYDIGVLLLAEPFPDVAYERLPRPGESSAIAQGAAVDIVGYGFTVASDLDHYGVKHDATTHIAGVGNAELKIADPGEPQNCQGDSGGPALLDVGDGRRLVSVVSRSAVNDTTDCSQGGIHTRTDAYLEWIHDQAEIPCGSGLAPDCPDDAEPDAGTPPGGGADAGGDPMNTPDAGGPGSPDAGSPGNGTGDDHECGGCRAAPGGGGGLALALAAGLLACFRRRRRRT